MPMIPLDPRPLSEAERAVLDRILSVDFEGVAELRAQLDRVEVVRGWGPESTSVDFRLPPDTRASTMRGIHVPVDATPYDETGEATGGFLLWVNHGVLDSLEHYWWTDDAPSVLPPPERVEVRFAATEPDTR